MAMGGSRVHRSEARGSRCRGVYRAMERREGRERHGGGSSSHPVEKNRVFKRK